MKRSTWCAALLLACCASAGAQKLPDNSAHVERIAWLIGTWVGGGEIPGQGRFTDEYRLQWSLNKNFVKSDYWMRVKGKVLWHDTGYMGWDKDRQRLVGFNFGIDGTIGFAAEVTKPEAGKPAPKVLYMEGHTTGNSPYKKFRVKLTLVEADTLQVSFENWDKLRKAFVEVRAMRYARKKEAAAKK